MAFTRASLIKVEIYRNMKGSYFIFCIIFKSNVFLRLLYAQRTRLTTHVPSRIIKFIRTHPIIFTCLNCIPPTKFTSTRARLLFTIYDSFPRKVHNVSSTFGFLRMPNNCKDIIMVVKQKVSHLHPVAVE